MQMFRRFKADQSGATAMLFGFAALPLVGMAGAAVDYSRASSYQSRMQLAVDATALAIVRSPATATQQEIQRKGEQYLASTLRSDANVALTSTSIKREGNVVKVAAAASMNTSLMQVLGIKTMPISTYSQATWSSDERKIEVALVLDNTGSMDDRIGGVRKMDELQSAGKSLLKSLRDLAKKRETIKVSVVPFDTEVRLDPSQNRYATWLGGLSAADRAAWTGYVYDRRGDYAANDDAPNSDPKSLYPAIRETEYRTEKALVGYLKDNPQNAKDLAPVRPLTSLYEYNDYRALEQVIEGMKPRGYTNIALGVAWGMATLSRSEPFTEAAAAGTKDLEKVMIVLTDGKNTMSHIDGTLQSNEDKIDTATSTACTSAKKGGVKVYTIRLLAGDVNLLKGCASSPGNYFDVQNSGELSKVFQVIFNDISGTLITH